MPINPGWTRSSFLTPEMVEDVTTPDVSAGPTGLLCSEHPKKTNVITAAMIVALFILISPLNLLMSIRQATLNPGHLSLLVVRNSVE
jgi:hypothetical protein